MSYNALSRFYDRLIDFDHQQLLAMLGQVKGVRSLDLACGTGIFTRLLAKAGASVEGVDLSDDMLEVAMDVSRKEGYRILYRQGDIRSFSFTRPYGLVTIICDGLNYVPPKQLSEALSHVASAIEEGGKLAFDLSTPYKLRNVLGNQLYYEDGEDLTYYWQNTLHTRSHSVEMQLTFFEKQGELYRRLDEEQTQYWHEMDEVQSALSSAGLTLVSCTDDKGNEPQEDSQRWVFVAKK